MAPFARCYHDMCRSLLRRHYYRGDVVRLVDDRVRALVGVPSVSAWFHWSRLGHLAALVKLRVSKSWALLHSEELWLCDARCSLAWLYQQLSPAAWQPDWARRETIECRPGVWRRALRRSCRWETLQEGWQHCKKLMAKCLLNAGAHVQQKCDVEQTGAFFCGPCQVRFRTRQQWLVHASFKTHTNIALCNHLDRSSRYRRHLVRQGFCCSPGPGLGNKKADRGFDFIGCAKHGHGQAFEDLGPGPGEETAAEVCEVTLQALAASVTERNSWACLNATVVAWRGRQLELGEGRSGALHTAVSQWVCCFWSANWLCGDAASSKGISLARSREGDLILSSIDFPADLLMVPVNFCSGGGFLTGTEQNLSAFGTVGAAWEHALCAKQCVLESGWQQLAHGVATAEDGGHLVFCFQDLPMIELSLAVVSEADFIATQAVHVLYQDVLLVLIQL